MWAYATIGIFCIYIICTSDVASGGCGCAPDPLENRVAREELWGCLPSLAPPLVRALLAPRLARGVQVALVSKLGQGWSIPCG